MKKKSKSKNLEIHDYDDQETTHFIDSSLPLTFQDLGLQLPDQPPTQVISIRLPTQLVNEIRSIGSERDIPYQALIKQYLVTGLKTDKKKSAG